MHPDVGRRSLGPKRTTPRERSMIARRRCVFTAGPTKGPRAVAAPVRARSLGLVQIPAAARCDQQGRCCDVAMGDSRWGLKLIVVPVDSTWMRRSLASGSRAKASHASRARAGRSRQRQSKWAGSTRKCTRTALVTVPFLFGTIRPSRPVARRADWSPTGPRKARPDDRLRRNPPSRREACRYLRDRFLRGPGLA
jgi:hypothetical protein